MFSKLSLFKAFPAVFLAMGAVLMQPAAYAQTPSTPGNMPMQSGQQAAPGAMPGHAGMKGMDMQAMMKDGNGMKNMDMQAMMKDGNDKMASMKMTGNPDVDFAMMMRIHHQGAINMAQAELRDGKAPEMQKMAKNIIAAQKKEIAQLDRFLAKNGHPVEAMKK